MTAPADYVLELPRGKAPTSPFTVAGSPAHSIGRFLSPYGQGEPNRASIGTIVTTIGALLTYMRRCRVGVRSVYYALRGSRWKIR
jgi:hypothetical protein